MHTHPTLYSLFLKILFTSAFNAFMAFMYWVLPVLGAKLPCRNTPVMIGIRSIMLSAQVAWEE